MRLDDIIGLRRIVLRIMLASLAITAALAALGVIAGARTDLQARMIGAGVAAAVASALLLASCKFLDSEKYRRTGLFVMGLILAVLLAFLMWMSSPGPNQDPFAETVACLLVAGIPAALFFHIRQFRGGRMAGLLGMALCGSAFALFLLGIWATRFGARQRVLDEFFWETGWACWFFALAATAAAAGIGADRRHWRWIGLAAGLISFSLGVRNIWGREDKALNLFTIATTVAILIGLANLLWLCQLNSGQGWLRWITAGFALAAGAMIDSAALINLKDDDPVWRLATAAAICAGCGTIAVALMTAFNRRAATRPTGGVDATAINFLCPVCSRKNVAAITDGIGENTCAGCGVIVAVKVSAPRCPKCDYVLLMLKSDRCPECGTVISGDALAPMAGPEAG